MAVVVLRIEIVIQWDRIVVWWDRIAFCAVEMLETEEEGVGTFPQCSRKRVAKNPQFLKVV